MREVRVKNVTFGGRRPLVLIAGPCVIESETACLETARSLKELTRPWESPGLQILLRQSQPEFPSLLPRTGADGRAWRFSNRVQREWELPRLSDVHRFEEVGPAAEVLDVLQVPAFLCRQTDFVVAVAGTGKAVNVKKGQFLAPWDVRNIVEKIESAGNQSILLTERGASFGYNNLVADMRSLVIMREHGLPGDLRRHPQSPAPGRPGEIIRGGRGSSFPALARAAVAVGIDGLFMEVHPNSGGCPLRRPNSQPFPGSVPSWSSSSPSTGRSKGISRRPPSGKTERDDEIGESGMEGAGERIRLLLLDVDGILTDGRIIYDGSGGELKSFHIRDGQGIRLLQRAGIKVGILTGRKSKAVEGRARELGMDPVCRRSRTKPGP